MESETGWIYSVQFIQQKELSATKLTRIREVVANVLGVPLSDVSVDIEYPETDDA